MKVLKSVKTRKNTILKEFIIEKYGSISKFTKKEKVPRGDVDVILHKAEIFNEMNIGMKVCNALNIDVEELFCKGNILTKTVNTVNTAKNSYNFDDFDIFEKFDISTNSDNENISDISSEDIIKEKCLRLGATEQKKILDFINKILEN